MSDYTKILRKYTIYLFSMLTLICAASTFYFAINGEASQRNISALSALVGMILVHQLRKDQALDARKNSMS